MSLWGAKDNIGSNGTVSLNYSTLVVTGAGTSFGQTGAASTGDVIRFGDQAGTYFGDAVIVGIASTTQLSIASTNGLSGAAIASTDFAVSQLPKYTVLDPFYSEVNTNYDAVVYGADIAETQASVNSSYSLTHAGWVGIITYMCDGELRTKTETLVAMSSIEGDADDDLVLPDAVIKILSQPTSVGVATTVNGTANFSVSVEVIPSSVIPTFQWQESDDAGVTFVDLNNGSTYSGTTTAGLAVTNTDASLDGYQYRVVVSVAGGFDVTSDAATMTVV